MTETTAAVETKEDFGAPPEATPGYWLAEIKAYEKTFDNWSKRGDAISKRYRNESEADTGTTEANPNRFQILWSNVQTIMPALYSRLPQPDITRTHKDRDQVARASAEILERAVRGEAHDRGFDGAMRGAVLDYLLTARGQARVRYVPTYGKETRDKIFLQAVPNEEDGTVAYTKEDGTPVEDEPKFEDGKPYIEDGELYRPVVSECVEFSHTSWRNFGHTPAPTWAKVRAVWFEEMMTRDQLIERFGQEKGKAVQLTKTAVNVDDQAVKDYGDAFKRAVVYEIWDRTSAKVIWISPGYGDGPLDQKPVPLKLEGFFPCPQPLFGTTTTDTLVPVADYDEYRTQAEEIDKLTARIGALTKALRYNGVYNGALGTVFENLLTQQDNKLIPVDEWAALGDRGIVGNMLFLPIKEVADVIVALSNIRTQLKQDLYEVTGISDILRGASDPNETLGAQQIKSQFGGMRIQDRQALVARFARDLIKIAAEIVAEHFSPETLWDISGWAHSTEARVLDAAVKDWEEQAMKAMLASQQSAQAAPSVPTPGGPALPQPGAAGTPPTAPPAAPPQLPERPPSARDVFDQAVALLRSDRLRGYKIEVETDQMVLEDQSKDREDRVALVTAVGGFLQQAMPAIQMYPQSAGVLVELLQFALRGWKTGRTLEAKFEEAGDQLMEAKRQPQQAPPPDPKAMEAQGKLAIEQQRLQIDQQKAAAEIATGERKAQLETQIKQQELVLKQQEFALKQRAQMGEITLKAAAHNKTVIDEQTLADGGPAQQGENPIVAMLASMQQMVAAMMAESKATAAGLAAVGAALSAPKRVDLVRDPTTGKAVGAVQSTVPQTIQ